MNDPHQKLESLERWSAHATLLIFLGIVIEIGLLFWFPHNAQERIGAITADAFIGTGLIVEYIVILRAIVASGEAERLSNEKIAESNRIAAEAQLELAKFRATRRSILSGHEASLTEKLKAFPGTEFDFGLAHGDGEAMHFAWDLHSPLVAAGWVHIPWVDFGPKLHQGNRPPSGQVAATNVEIHIRPQSRAKLLLAATELISGLNEIGIAATDAGCNMHSSNDTAIHILIGPTR
ncbi:MAG: hypothetical protein ACLQE9_13335 [Roseiarcus sp.]